MITGQAFYSPWNKASKYLAALVIIIAVSGLAGWQFGIELLMRPLPFMATMNPTGAIMFILSGLILFALKLPAENFYRRGATIPAILIAVTGIIRLIEIAFNLHTGVDQWLFPGKLNADALRGIYHHIPPNAAFNFSLLGSALLLSNSQNQVAKRMANLFASIIFLVGMFSLLGYIYRVPEFYGLLVHLPMPVHAAVCFVLLALAIVTNNQQVGLMQTLTSNYSGGEITRTLFPAIILAPIVFGFGMVWLSWQQTLSTEMVVAALISSVVLFLFALTWYLGKKLNNSDEGRSVAEENLKRFNKNLEVLVKERTEELAATEKTFRNTLDNMLEGVQIIDFNWRYIYVNDAVVRESGYTKDQLLGSKLFEKYPGIENTALFNALKQCMEERVAVAFETEFIYPDKSSSDFEFSMQPTTEGIYVHTVNITEKKKAREKLIKANRLYAFISSVNKSIVQIKDQSLMLDNICTIALQIGKFKTAWIALVDENRRLNMISLHGTETGIKRVIKHSGIDIDDPLIRDLNTGKVLRTGKYVINNDMQNAPAYQAWKEEFIRDNIKASISLPIFMSGKVIGVFSLQADQNDFFDAEEIELLEEAAGDISFALENFEKERLRHLAESEVKKEKLRLKRAQAIAHMGSWELDIATGIALWSDETCRIMEVPLSENRQTRPLFLAKVHPEDREYVTKMMDEGNATGRDNSYEHRIIRKDGTIRHLHIERHYEFDSTGKAILLQGIMQDITEKKLVEKELENSEKRFREFFENSPEAITILDLNTKFFTGYNANAIKLLKLSGEEIRIKGPVTISPEFQPDGRKSKEKAREYIAAALNGERLVFEWLIINGEEKEIMCEVRLAALSNNKSPQMLATFVDIGERKKIEAQQALFVSIVNSSEDAIISKNLDGTITGWNYGAEKVLGYSSEETVGQNIALLVPPDLMEEEKEIQEKIRKCESIAHYETRRIKKNGEIIYVSLTVSPIKDASGKVTGASKILRDITGKKETENLIRELNENLEERVQERTAELSEANKALEAFSSTVSHDLRGPVRAINSFVKIIKTEHGPALNPDLKELLGFIDDSGKRMNAIIDDLLKLAKYGKEKLRLEPVNMTQLVNGIWINIAHSTTHNAVLKLTELPEVMVDMSMMQQVVVNLLTNAIKYSSKKDSPVISIWSEQTTETVTFFFKDNGAGFDMEQYEKLFGAFQRLHSAHEFEGTGVGLTLVKKIIEKHSGTIAATAKKGEGAIFYFTLPLTR